MQAIILVSKSQSVKHFLLKYIIVRLSSSAVYLPPVDDVHIKILEHLVVCEKWCEGGQQCSVTSSWWWYLGAYTFIGCKLHCCILTFLTHYRNLTYFSLVHFISINITDWRKQHDHVTWGMCTIHTYLCKHSNYYWEPKNNVGISYPTFTPLFATLIIGVVMSMFTHTCPHSAMHSPSIICMLVALDMSVKHVRPLPSNAVTYTQR